MREQAFESETGEVCYLWPMNEQWGAGQWVVVVILVGFVVWSVAMDVVGR